jgi:type IV secretory pathway TrbF-like protein
MTTQWTPDGPLDTPYRRARQEWDTRMGSLVVQAKNWRLACFASLALVGFSIVGAIYLGAQPKAVPHIIEVDRLGGTAYRGPVGEKSYEPSDAVITYHLRRFLSDTREVSSDLAVLKRNWMDAYTLVTPRGGNMLTAYVQAPDHDPFRRALEQRVTVEFLSAVRVAGDTWQVDWRESEFDKNGNPSGAATWRAMLRTILQTPKTPEAMSRNPIGLFIDELHWDKVGG